MNAKLEELQNAIKEKEAELEKHLEDGKIDEAGTAKAELEKLEEIYDIAKVVYD